MTRRPLVNSHSTCRRLVKGVPPALRLGRASYIDVHSLRHDTLTLIGNILGMPRIAISYRRDDSLDITGRIFDRLARHFGRKAVFRDIDNILPGVDFRRHIERMLDESDIVLEIVGPRWIGPGDEQGRLKSAADREICLPKSTTAGNNPNIQKFNRWLQRMDYSQLKAAEELELPPTTIYNYTGHRSKLPKYILLACEALVMKKRRKDITVKVAYSLFLVTIGLILGEIE